MLVYMGRSLLIFSNVISKWPPGSHIGFCGFRTLTLVWLWILTPNLSGTMLIYMGRSISTFSDVTFKVAAWWPYWIFCVSGLTLVWLWISTPNLSGTIFMYMCRSLSIFSNVDFKMAARQPYWILWFPDSNFSLALNINSKFNWHNTYIYIWVGAYWFSAMSLTKWPPGGHIGFFGFRTKFSLALNINSKLQRHTTYVYW